MHTLFQDRFEAGRRLAGRLDAYAGADSVMLAVPRGGVPVARESARILRVPWSVIVSKELPVPWSTSASFGAVADGAVVLNEAMVHGLGLNKETIKTIVEQVEEETGRCQEFYAPRFPNLDVAGKCAIIIDDGIASGYTTMAAVKLVRSRGASKVVAAAPIASRLGASLIGECADECIFEIVSPALPFSIGDFYISWHELTDEDVLRIADIRHR